MHQHDSKKRMDTIDSLNEGKEEKRAQCRKRNVRLGPRPALTTPSSDLKLWTIQSGFGGRVWGEGSEKHPGIVRTALYRVNSTLRNNVLDATSKLFQNSVKNKNKNREL